MMIKFNLKMRNAFFLVLLPLFVYGNTAAPLTLVISGLGFLFLPIIIILEGLFLKFKKVPNPFFLVLIVNLFSSIVGGVFFGIAGVFLFSKGVVFESSTSIEFWMSKYPQANYQNKVIALISIGCVFLLLNYVLSAWLEFFAANRMKKFKNFKLPFKIFLQANSLSYLVLFIYFIVDWYRMVKIVF